MVIYLQVFKEPHYDVSNSYEQIIVFHITSYVYITLKYITRHFQFAVCID